MIAGATWDSNATKFAGRSLPYAIRDAINATLLEAQSAQRAGMRRRFTIRRADFADRSVKIPREGFATPKNLRGEIRIAGPTGNSGTNPFAALESFRFKVPAFGGRRIAVPLDVRRTPGQIIRKGERPRALLDETKGAERAWVHEKGDGTALLYVVRGRGKSATISIAYVLRPGAPVRPRLEFRATVEATARRVLRGKVIDAVRREAATFKPVRG